jgi:hypothetical protein
MIEMGDLLAKNEVLEERRAAPIGAERVLVVGDRRALVRRQRQMAAARELMELASFARPFAIRDLTR